MTNKGKALIWIAFGITILFVVLYLAENKRFLLSHPAYTTGIVVKIDRGAKGPWLYIDYSFNVGGITYSGWVTKENCPACKVGSSVKIMYAEGNPNNSEIIP